MASIVTQRWLIRGYAFAAILIYGIYILSSQKRLKKLVYEAFDVASNSTFTAAYDANSDGSSGAHAHTHAHAHGPYHKHMHAIPKQHNNTSDANIRISVEIHKPQTKPIQNIFNLYVTCPLGQVMGGNKRNRKPTGEIRSGALPSALQYVNNTHDLHGNNVRSGRILDFTVSISTNLKLLLIGDSVMVQLAQAFDELIIPDDATTNNQTATSSHREVVWEAWRGHDGGTIAKTRGGGISALWRMTGLLSQSKKGAPPANSAGGGWSDKEITALKSYSYIPEGGGSSSSKNATIGNFDVVVLRVMHGWMKGTEITHDRLVEAVTLSGELLGAKTVVLMTVPFTNNVLDTDEMTRVKFINRDIRDIARTWSTRSDESAGGGVQHVLVLEYGTYYNHIIWSNARYLGYNVTSPLLATSEHIFDEEGPSFLLDRLHDGQQWSPSIPMVCSDISSLGSERKICNRAYLFLDGMHVCPESLASRYSAGLACLIGCVYNSRDGRNAAILDKENGYVDDIRSCEAECNRQFFSVMPIEESWVDSGITLASFPT